MNVNEQLELPESSEEQQRQQDQKQLKSDTKDDEVKNEIKQELETDEKSSKNSESLVIDEPELKPEMVEKNELIDEEKESSEDEGMDNEPMIEYLDTASLYHDPTFAEIVSFFNTFAHLLSVQPLSIEKLSKLFTTIVDRQVSNDLIDLHVTLLRKIYLKSTRADKWEKAMQKFCSLTSGLEVETRQLQRQNYLKIPLSSKLNIMKALCDSQFDWNLKFKENIANTFRCNELRMSPIGSDKTGQLYYFQLDCDLAYRVYTEEPDDMAGTSWTLKASNEMELAELLETLKSPEFGKKTKEEEEEEQADAEIDEEQILDQPKEEEKRKDLRPSSAGSGGSKSEIVKKIQMSDEEKKKIRMEDKNVIYWDRYKRQEILNKRKLERENRKKERLIGSTALKIVPTEIVQNEPENREEKNQETENKEKNEDEKMKEIEKKNDMNEEQKKGKIEMVEKELNQINGEKEEEEKAARELDEALLAELETEDRRRILPRRNARNTAIQNIKVFTMAPRRRNDDSSEAQSTLPIQKLGFVATAGSASEEESDEEESDEEADEGRTSDDEFYLDEDERPKVRKLGRPPTKRMKMMKAGKTKKGGKIKGKGKKKDSRGRQIARQSALKMVISRKQQSVTFVDEESSGVEEETDDEVKREEKERRRATALSLCQRCRQGTQPDLLLLCDSCDDAWHTHCLRPQLWFVPDGDWFCPLCQHSSLIQRLTFVLVTVREERKAQEQNDKKKAAEDRLKREMDFIGSQLNDIMARKNEEAKIREISSDEDDDEDEDEDGEPQRKSKKRAMKIVMSRTRQQRKLEKKFYAAPVMTIAEGRSRRALNKVDYNFRSYNEQLQEAMGIDSDGKGVEEVEESCGAGKGKDMQNIVELKRKREEQKNRNDDEEEEEEEQGQRGRMAERNEKAPARPLKGTGVKKAIRKQHKRLTDLDCDNVTESDTDEWQQGSEDEFEEDPEPSEDEYLPSERRRNGIRGKWARHRSDDEFINDDSDPDYMEESKRKRKEGGRKGRGGWFTRKKSKGKYGKHRSKKKKDESSSEEDEGEEMPSGSDSDNQAGPSKRRKILATNGPTKKWNPKANSSDSEEENEEEEESEVEMTETGRPLRRSAANSKKKLKEIEKAEEEEEDEEEAEEQDDFVEEKLIKDEKIQAKSGENIERLADRAVSALAKPTVKATAKMEDIDEFEPDSEEEEAIDDEEEELEKELAELSNEDEEEGNEKEERSSSSESDNESGNEERIIPAIGKKSALTSPKMAPLAKKKITPQRRGKKGSAIKKSTKTMITRKKSTGKTSKSDEDEKYYKEADEIKEKKSQKQEKKTTPNPKQLTSDEPKASTSIPVNEQQPTQRQTRQQLRRQQSSTTSTQITISNMEKKKSPALMISTSMGMAASNESSSTIPSPPAIQQLKTEKQLPPSLMELSPSPKKLNDKQLAQARSFESNKSPLKTTEVNVVAFQGNEVKKTVEIQVAPKTSNKQTSIPTTNIPAFTNQQQMSKGTTAISTKSANVAIASTTNTQQSGPNSVNSSPVMKTIFQPVQPQQLSQYFLRPSTNTPPPPSIPHPQHQPPPRHQLNTTTSAGAGVNVPLQQQMSTTTIVHHGPPRFTFQPAPTTSYAYSISPSVGTMSNGNPTFVSVAPHQQHMPTSGPGPIGLVHQQPHHLPPGTIPHHFPPHSQPTAYFVQQGPAGGPPQIIYQTLQPYTTVMHHPPPTQGQPPMLLQPGMTADPESLSHALAGAMNPEDL